MKGKETIENKLMNVQGRGLGVGGGVVGWTRVFPEKTGWRQLRDNDTTPGTEIRGSAPSLSGLGRPTQLLAGLPQILNGTFQYFFSEQILKKKKSTPKPNLCSPYAV